MAATLHNPSGAGAGAPCGLRVCRGRPQPRGSASSPRGRVRAWRLAEGGQGAGLRGGAQSGRPASWSAPGVACTSDCGACGRRDTQVRVSLSAAGVGGCGTRRRVRIAAAGRGIEPARQSREAAGCHGGGAGCRSRLGGAGREAVAGLGPGCRSRGCQAGGGALHTRGRLPSGLRARRLPDNALTLS